MSSQSILQRHKDLKERRLAREEKLKLERADAIAQWIVSQKEYELFAKEKSESVKKLYEDRDQKLRIKNQEAKSIREKTVAEFLEQEKVAAPIRQKELAEFAEKVKESISKKNSSRAALDNDFKEKKKKEVEVWIGGEKALCSKCTTEAEKQKVREDYCVNQRKLASSRKETVVFEARQALDKKFEQNLIALRAKEEAAKAANMTRKMSEQMEPKSSLSAAEIKKARDDALAALANKQKRIDELKTHRLAKNEEFNVKLKENIESYLQNEVVRQKEESEFAVKMLAQQKERNEFQRDSYLKKVEEQKAARLQAITDYQNHVSEVKKQQ